MKKLRTVIVDDDPLNIVDLKDCLLPYAEKLEIIGEFHDGLEACRNINAQKPDLAFLDIEMPGMDGFQMLAELEYIPVIIFVTAHAKFALESFDHSPSDFLLKPVDPAKLKRAVGNALNDYLAENSDQRLTEQQRTSGHLPLKYKDIYGITRNPFISPENVLFFRTCVDDSHYIEVHTDDGHTYKPIKQSLSRIFKLLNPDAFIYVYKNTIANREKFVELIDNKYLILKGKENVKVVVSRRYKKAIVQTFKNSPD